MSTPARSTPGPVLDPGVAVLTAGMWKGTISGGVFTPVGPAVLAPADDPAAHNLRAVAQLKLPLNVLGINETCLTDVPPL